MVETSACGLRLHDEAVRVAVALRLGLPLCAPRQCHCGAFINTCGIHSFVLKCAPGRSAKHYVLNELIARASASAVIPAAKELTAGQRPMVNAQAVCLSLLHDGRTPACCLCGQVNVVRASPCPYKK